MKTYTVIEYEMDDYDAARDNMSDSEAIDLLKRIDRGYIPDYNFTGKEDDFENFKLHVAIQQGVNAIDKQNKDNLPDDGWFRGSDEVRPVDKQFCLVIFTGGGIKLVQYIRMRDVFHDLSIPTYYSWGAADRWMPIELPDDVKKRILNNMEEWTEEVVCESWWHSHHVIDLEKENEDK